MIIDIMFYMDFLLIAICIISYLILLCIEVKEWNKGKCPRCNKPWAFYFSSKDKEVSYVCESGHVCRISNKIINRKFIKSKKENRDG